MTVILTYVGEHHLVSATMTNLLRLALVDDNQVEFKVDPRPLDLENSALEVTLKDLLLDSDQERDWDFQDDLGLLMETLNDHRWRMVTLRHTMLYQVIQSNGDHHPSQVIANRLTSTRH